MIIEGYRCRESAVAAALIGCLWRAWRRCGADPARCRSTARLRRPSVRESRRKLPARIEDWRTRPIEGAHPYLSPGHRDEAVSHCSARNGDRAGERRNVSLLVARAFSSEGYRGILGISKGPWEDTSGGSALPIICPGRAGSAVRGGPNHWRNHGRAWFNSTAILRHVP